MAGNPVGLSAPQMLAEVHALLRSMPSATELMAAGPAVLEWRGRANAVVSLLRVGAASWRNHMSNAVSDYPDIRTQAYNNLVMMLHELIYELRLKSGEHLSTAIDKGGHFEYFDTIRKVIELAKADILFVDPYLDADFVARYMPFVTGGTRVRLLTAAGKWMNALVPAARAYAAQEGLAIEVREDSNLHDRFVLIDGVACYQSGASFKDGPKNADSVVSQIVDLFPQVRDGYEARWAAARPRS